MLRPLNVSSLEPSMMRIEDIAPESSLSKSFFFKGTVDCKPGQFVMLWIPRLDEKPFSVSHYGESASGGFGITVALRGRFTQRLHQMRVGDVVGVRGPFGNPFIIGEGPACVIGGGIGMASLALLIGRLKRPVVIQGARTGAELLYQNRFKDMALCTEDGSAGRKGMATDVLEELHARHRFKAIYTCGPEEMMVRVFEFSKKHDIPVQASLERYIKCGIGLCGQCCCNGLRICVEGPVLNSETLATLGDFGRAARLRNGCRVTLKEYLSPHQAD